MDNNSGMIFYVIKYKRKGEKEKEERHAIFENAKKARDKLNMYGYTTDLISYTKSKY